MANIAIKRDTAINKISDKINKSGMDDLRGGGSGRMATLSPAEVLAIVYQCSPNEVQDILDKSWKEYSKF